MRNSPYLVLHIAHPRPARWPDIMVPISQALHLPLVPYPEWLSRLHASQKDSNATSEVEQLKANPALMLMDFFTTGAPTNDGSTDREALRFRTLDVKKAVAVSPALQEQNLPKLGESDALAWVTYWKKIGFLSA